jgi:type II secretory pathway pseudopilin PulG
MKRSLRKPWPPGFAVSRGIGLVEPLMLTLLLMIVIGATANIFNSINRRTVSTQQQVVMQAAIDDNVRQIKTLARQFTCCSGTCTTTIPTTFGVVANVTQPCATNNPMDDRYYYPQVDLASTTALNEQLAVDTLCQTDATNNLAFMTPLKDAVDALAQPTNATRRAALIDNSNPHVLRVTYTDNNSNRGSRVVRIENIIPRMAFFCA